MKRSWGFANLVILIIVLLALLTGSYLYWQGGKEGVPTPSPVPTPTPESTPTPTPLPIGADGWKTYVNTEYSYEVRFPGEWVLSGPEEVGSKTIITLGSSSKALERLQSDEALLVVYVTRRTQEGEAYSIIVEDFNKFQAYIAEGSVTLGGVRYSVEEKTVDGRVAVSYTNETQQLGTEPLYRTLVKVWTDEKAAALDLYAATKTAHSLHLPIFNQVLSSFRFLDQSVDTYQGNKPLFSKLVFAP